MTVLTPTSDTPITHGPASPSTSPSTTRATTPTTTSVTTHAGTGTTAVRGRRPAAGTDTAPTLHPKFGAAILKVGKETIAPYKRGPRTFVPLICDVADATVDHAVAEATTFLDTLGLYPGDPAEVTDLFTDISTWANDHGIRYLLNIVEATAEQLICDLVGIPDLAFEPPARPRTRGRVSRPSEEEEREQLARLARDRDHAHRVHNALVALRAAVVMTRHRTRKVRHAKDSLALGLPRLKARTGVKYRPLHDDEVLLARFLVELDLREEAAPRPVLAYLVAETGITCIESTILTTDALDHRDAPTTISTTGAWEFGKRDVELSDYVRRNMRLALAELGRGVDSHTGRSVERLTYDGAGPGTEAAHASLGPQLARQLRRAGVTDADVTPKSINRWRAKHALLNGEDFAAVLNYHGGSTVNLLEQLKLQVDETDASEGWITLIDAGDNPVEIQVPRREYTEDRSTTLKKRRGQTHS